MQHSTRTVRFKKDELKLIDQFLEKNPFFDFSSLARLAIKQFIREPKFDVTPVNPKKNSRRRRTDDGSIRN